MIRFKKDDGSNYPDWEENELNKLYPKIRNGFVGTVTEHFSDKEKGIRYIEGTNIHNGIISDNIEVYVTKEFHRKHIKNELKADDILMVQSGHVGECAVVGDKYKGSNCHALIIMSNGGKCNSKFMCEYFYSYTGRKKLSVLVTGNTVKHILSSDMNNFRCKIPCLEEQQKIADFLSSVNEVISSSEKEVANLEEQKKGVMQKIFSQEVRFKADDGSDYPEWEEKKLGELTIFHKQGYYTKENYIESGVRLARVSDLYNPYVDYSAMPMIEMSEKDFKAFKVEIGDFLIARSGSIGRYGIVYELPEDKKVVFGSFVIKFIFNSELLNTEYFGQFYNSSFALRQLNRITQAGANININTENIKIIIVPLPCLEEQQKIANFLSDFDTAIEKAKAELECWKEIKKGLLQQLF